MPRYRGWSDRALPVNASQLLSHCWTAISGHQQFPALLPPLHQPGQQLGKQIEGGSGRQNFRPKHYPGGRRLAYATPAAPEPFICQSANFGSTFDRTGKLGNQSNFRPDL
ncbi:TPA: hypothetical protein QDB60_000473 [Burkholderia multivorans]|nr:hypothetical protein [Burkholderia multivorans]